MKPAILFSSYLAPIEYYFILKNSLSCIIEYHENFIKQSYRSRCEIYSPNGKLTLSIPLIKRNHRQATKEIKISYNHNWQKIHWRSLESSYRRSPFFEFYEDDLLPFYSEKKFEYLIDFNEAIQQQILKLLKLKTNYSFSSSYQSVYENANDFRNAIATMHSIEANSSFQPKQYSQVFDTRHNFIPNLSIVDLLFNQGNRALDYI